MLSASDILKLAERQPVRPKTILCIATPPNVKRATMIKRRPSRPRARPPLAAPEALKGEPKAAEIGERIGHNLRAMFADVVAEPVPERFRALLGELERKL